MNGTLLLILAAIGDGPIPFSPGLRLPPSVTRDSMESNTQSPQAQPVTGVYNIQNLFLRQYDQDGDGRLTAAELPANLAKKFDKTDTNGDGYLDANEVLLAQTRIGQLARKSENLQLDSRGELMVHTPGGRLLNGTLRAVQVPLRALPSPSGMMAGAPAANPAGDYAAQPMPGGNMLPPPSQAIAPAQPMAPGQGYASNPGQYVVPPSPGAPSNMPPQQGVAPQPLQVPPSPTANTPGANIAAAPTGQNPTSGNGAATGSQAPAGGGWFGAITDMLGGGSNDAQANNSAPTASPQQPVAQQAAPAPQYQQQQPQIAAAPGAYGTYGAPNYNAQQPQNNGYGQQQLQPQYAQPGGQQYAQQAQPQYAAQGQMAGQAQAPQAAARSNVPTPQELAAMAAANGGYPPADKIVAILDKNGNGFIDGNEAVDDLRDNFKRLDKNRDGRLSVDEIDRGIRLAKMLGIKPKTNYGS